MLRLGGLQSPFGVSWWRLFVNQKGDWILVWIAPRPQEIAVFLTRKEPITWKNNVASLLICIKFWINMGDFGVEETEEESGYADWIHEDEDIRVGHHDVMIDVVTGLDMSCVVNVQVYMVA